MEPKELKELEFKLSQMAAHRASGDPLPGPLLDAFLDGPIKVGDIEVRSVKPGDWIILKKINSPVYLLTIESDPKEVLFDDEDAIELIYLFTRPAKDCRNVLVKGRAHFRETALQEIADKLDSATIKVLTMAIREQLQRSYSTTIKYSQSESDNGKTVAEANFPEPIISLKTG